MKIKYLRKYRKQDTGNLVFVYAVIGSAADIARYEKAQGEHLKTDEETGQPLYFSRRYHKDNTKLIITSTGNVAVDTSATDKQLALIEEHKGSPLGDYMAQEMAKKMLADVERSSGRDTSSNEAPEKETVAEGGAEEAGDGIDEV